MERAILKPWKVWHELVGRELFRSKITKYQMATFEDRVIFVHDMGRCLERLDDFGRQVLGRIVLQEYGQEDAGRLLGYTRMTSIVSCWSRSTN